MDSVGIGYASDAANFGCNAAATAAAFIIFTITTKFNKLRIFYPLYI